MTKLQKIFLGVFLLLLAGMVYMEATKPPPVSWFPSYNNQDEIPLGTVVLYDVLEQNFNENLTEIDRPPYEVLQDTTLQGTYLFINNSIGQKKATQFLLVPIRWVIPFWILYK